MGGRAGWLMAWAAAFAWVLMACGGGSSGGKCTDGEPCGNGGTCYQGTCLEPIDGSGLPDVNGADVAGDVGADTADAAVEDTAVEDTAIEDTAVEDATEDTVADAGEEVVEDTVADAGEEVVEDTVADAGDGDDAEVEEGECLNGIVEGTEECDDGNEDDDDFCHTDCTLACGDGVLQDFETCDVALEAGQDGACPSECVPEAACTVGSLEGEECEQVCVFAPVTECVAGDGCCGFGCDAVADPDCPSACGNGVIEPGETCDPKGTCPTECEDDFDPCTVETLTGSLDTCDAACEVATILACEGGDLCCPGGCNAGNDGDCSPTCGDGWLDEGETCDPPEDCPVDCVDGDACTQDLLAGSAENCNAACSNPAITEAAEGDGCCPDGANANTDGDCEPDCGNGVIEGDEGCDPCDPCPAQDGCTVWEAAGSVETCDLVCTEVALTECVGGDLCCAPGCSLAEDPDCDPVCGNGVLEPGEGCDPCPETCDDEDPCTLDGSSGSADGCDVVCSHEPVIQAFTGDGCCPDGANANSDGDCEPDCGNGVVEEGELCDPCPSACDDGDACTVDLLSGTGCQAFCDTEGVTACGAAEGCCPEGCTSLDDGDCDPVCGNGEIEEGEVCDPCPATCDDDDPCTTDGSTGSLEACTLVCGHADVTDPVGGDGCCPDGANANNDSDCEPDCGNGVVESAETCDPCSACPAGSGCSEIVAAGSADGCDLTCTEVEVTACVGGDACCPSGCTSNDDGDCSASCGNGEIEEGETCDPPNTCPFDCSDGDACTADKLVGNPLNCNSACQNPSITLPASGDGCCPDGANANSDDDCDPSCGNGVVEEGELCDPCPTACDDGDVCTTDALVGSGCSAQCEATPITAPADDDGCCPDGANANTDGDCDPECGNGAVEAGETCDPCAADCVDGDPCTKDSASGSPDACTLVCSHPAVTDPVGGDGCCPDGANANNDSDCDPVCGNGEVEDGELCDPCPTACSDGEVCTEDVLSGSGCNAACSYPAITEAADGDGCCPDGADATSDSDCAAVCGNGVVEGVELCDPCPTSCSDGDACTEDVLVGSGCFAECTFPEISAPADGDGCCPDGENANTDSDCEPVCGNGAQEAGETCDPCPVPTVCDDGDACTEDTPTGDPGLCVVGCQFATISACSTGDGCCPEGCSALDDGDCEAPIDPLSAVTLTSECLTAGAQGEATVVLELADEAGAPVVGASVTMSATAGNLSPVTSDGALYWAVLKAPLSAAGGSATVTVTADGVVMVAKPVVVFAAPMTDLAGGAGGCPADGNLRVRVVDEAGSPLSGAFVMVGSSAAATLQPGVGAAATAANTATTNGAGYAFFRDVGSQLDGPLTVTAAASARQYMTFADMDASDVVLPLDLVDPQVATGQLTGDVTSLPAPSGDPIELAVVFSDLSVEALANFNLSALLADDDCYNIGGFAGQQAIPGNVYIPQQCAASLFGFCLQTLPKHAYTSAPLTLTAHKMLALRGSAPLDALTGGGGISDALGQLTLNGIGVVDKTVTSTGTVTQNVGVSQTLASDVSCAIAGAPAASDVFCLTAGDWDSAGNAALTPGEGRLMVGGFKLGDATGKTGTWTISGVTRAPKAGAFSGITYVGAAVALYLTDTKPGTPAGTVNGQTAVMNRGGSPFGNSGGTMAFNDFLPVRTLTRTGRDYTLSALPAAGAWPTPGFVRADVQQRISETYTVCSGGTSSRSETRVLWQVYAPAVTTGWTLPTPPTDWPRAAAGGQYAGLVDPAATAEADQVRWRALTVHEGLNPAFDFDALRLRTFRRFVTHVSTNEQGF